LHTEAQHEHSGQKLRTDAPVDHAGKGENFAPTADLIYWDSTTTVLSFTAMWMTARKYLESWIVWLVIDILLAGIYFYKGIFPYAFLYTIYIGLAVAGWMRWSRSVNRIGVEQTI